MEFLPASHGGSVTVKIADIDESQMVTAIKQGKVKSRLMPPKAGAPDPGLIFDGGVWDDQFCVGSRPGEFEVVNFKAIPLIFFKRDGGKVCAFSGLVGKEVLVVPGEFFVALVIGVDTISGVARGDGTGEVVEVNFRIGGGSFCIGHVNGRKPFRTGVKVGLSIRF